MKKLIWFLTGFCLFNVVFHRSSPKYTQEEVKEKVESFFEDTPILIDIAACESQFHQWDMYGKVYLGEINKNDTGVMQINTYHHGREAKRLGFDVKSLEDNMAFAKYLYDREGTKPWNSSSRCWKKRVAQRYLASNR